MTITRQPTNAECRGADTPRMQEDEMRKTYTKRWLAKDTRDARKQHVRLSGWHGWAHWKANRTVR